MLSLSQKVEVREERLEDLVLGGIGVLERTVSKQYGREVEGLQLLEKLYEMLKDDLFYLLQVFHQEYR